MLRRFFQLKRFVARRFRILRSSDIKVAQLSKLRIQREGKLGNLPHVLGILYLSSLRASYSAIFVHRSSKRFLDAARNDKESVACDEFRDG